MLEVIWTDGPGTFEPFGVAGPELAVGDRGQLAVVAWAFCLVRPDHDAERLAPAGRTVGLHEGDIVPPGEDADPIGRDDLAAGGARNPAGERIEVVARIHRPQV